MKNALLCLCLILIPVLSFSQPEEEKILLTIGNHKISLSEFEWIHQKNNIQNVNNLSTTVEEYLDLFINFKLKVVEAENLGMDTLSNFKKELAGYREQLAKTYLTDIATIEILTREAYDRLKTEVNVSHILVKLKNNPAPEDTLTAYKKAIAIRTRIQLGESFESIARSTSDDPTAKTNGGNLGYFNAFQMVYPFENAAYKNDTGIVTMPVRTKYGYHILLINDKREAQGKVKVAHIMVAVPRGSSKKVIDSAKVKIFRIYKLLNKGESFTELAKKYSDDRGSARDGGELPWFGTGRMVPEFEKAAFSINENGDIGEPVQTNFGWHIIKRIGKQDLESYNELKHQIKEKVYKSGRAKIAREAFVNKLKDKYNFYTDSAKLSDYDNLITPEVINSGRLPEKLSELNSILFSFSDNNYYQSDFNRYVMNSKSGIDPDFIKTSVLRLFSEFVSQELIQHEKQRLETNYPEFRYLMQEYHDGILLFEIMDKKVWTKAIEDTTGLKKFYETQKNKYLTEEQADATIYTLHDNSVLNKLNRMVRKRKQKKYTDKDFNIKFNHFPDTNNLTIAHGTYKPEENYIIDQVKWNTGNIEYVTSDGKTHVVVIHKILTPEPKPLIEIRGLVTADYQDFLEKKWLQDLKHKYPVSVNKKLISLID
ncbi:MAG: peptidylprolyl isomerase [Bacteroidetes bacterium]|nr:peptidylprolyl isomerase [Bacteroidota bacterium]